LQGFRAVATACPSVELGDRLEVADVVVELDEPLPAAVSELPPEDELHAVSSTAQPADASTTGKARMSGSPSMLHILARRRQLALQ
jgi:hypothetical protein